MEVMSGGTTNSPQPEPGPIVDDLSGLVDPAIDLVSHWLRTARATEQKQDKAVMGQLEQLIDDPDGVAFTMRFVDRVVRPDADRVAAGQLASLVEHATLPGYLTTIDRFLLRAGGVLGPRLPKIVMPLARRRMRQLVGHLVVDAEPEALADHLSVRREAGFDQNVNLLGEAVLGEREAAKRFDATTELLGQPDVDYVSIKVSAVASQLEPWAWDEGLARITLRLRELFRKAAAASPPTFVNLDMEEYHDLELTMEDRKSVV